MVHHLEAYLDNGWAYRSNMDSSIQMLTLILPLVILISLNGDSWLRQPTYASWRVDLRATTNLYGQWLFGAFKSLPHLVRDGYGHLARNCSCSAPSHSSTSPRLSMRSVRHVKSTIPRIASLIPQPASLNARQGEDFSNIFLSWTTRFQIFRTLWIELCLREYCHLYAPCQKDLFSPTSLTVSS